MIQRFWMAMVAGVLSVVAASALQPIPRVIYWERGKHISKQLLPDDEVVVVVKGQSRHLGAPLPLEADLRRIDETASAIAMVEIQAIQAAPTARGDWAITHAHSKVLELIKSSNRAPLGLPDLSLDFDFDGGELKFGKTTVLVGEYPLVKIGERYLIMFALDPAALKWHPFQPFRVADDGRLFRVKFFTPEPIDVSSPLEGKHLDDIAARLRALQKKP